MAQERETGDVDRSSGESRKRGPGGGARSRQRSGDSAVQVQAVKAALIDTLGPHERIITYLQAVLLWERPVHSLILYTFTNFGFWFFVLSSMRLVLLLALVLALVVCVDTWRNKIWPKIKAKRAVEGESESWGLVQPGTLSVPELCHHMAEVWVSGASCAADVIEFKRHNPGQFCALVCVLFSFLATVGRYIPGVVLSYVTMWGALLCPLALYYRLWPRVCVRLEPALQWLDFSVRGYMMSKPINNQFLRRPIRSGTSGDISDSEEELAAFCPTFDDALVAKELAMTDSEHSDAEVSYTENGTFNLSRGQTPLTEGSEDLDRHSDPEESFAQDLQDFPSINPDATLMDDDDDPSLGLPSMASAGICGTRASTSSAMLDLDAQLDSDQDDLDTDLSLGGLNLTSDITGDLAGILASNMIQAALSGAMQVPRTYRKQSSSELDLDPDLDQDDFELLDQSELNQMDPVGGSAVRGSIQNRTQGSSFLSNLLGKPK